MSKMLGFIVLFVVFVGFSFVAIMLLWGWIVPDVFSGAVKAGVLPESLTFLQAVKLSILIAILFGSGKTSKS